MTTTTTEPIEQFNRLSEAQQQRLFSFAGILANTPAVQGEPGTGIVQAVRFFDAHALDDEHFREVETLT